MTSPTSLRTAAAVAVLTLVATACGAADDTPGAAPSAPTSAPPSIPTTAPPSTTTVRPSSTSEIEPIFDREAARAELDAARDRWGAAEPFAYRLRYAPICFCPRQELEVVVIDATRIAATTGDEVWGHVYDWFGEIELAIETAYDLRVEYDDRGVPISLYIDWDPMIADEESGMELTELTAIDDVLGETLTDEYGCGYGFWTAAPTQRIALMVNLGQHAAIGTAYRLGDQNLAEVQVGDDLMSNWCDDAIEPDEPEPDVQEAWPLVGGTVELVALGERTATAELRDVVARRPDGSEVALGDLTVTNPFWGQFAG